MAIEGGFLLCIKHKLGLCQHAIRTWDIPHSLMEVSRLKELQQDLSQLLNRENSATSEQTNQLQKEINIELEQADLQWKQRAKQDWLKGGIEIQDFFTRVLIRGRNLILYKVEDDNGCVKYEAKAIKEIFFSNCIRFFSKVLNQMLLLRVYW